MREEYRASPPQVSLVRMKAISAMATIPMMIHAAALFLVEVELTVS
jgi:hypothetical protein